MYIHVCTCIIITDNNTQLSTYNMYMHTSLQTCTYIYIIYMYISVPQPPPPPPSPPPPLPSSQLHIRKYLEKMYVYINLAVYTQCVHTGEHYPTF